MSKIVIAGNWKMNKTFDEAKDFIEKLMKEDLSSVEATMQLFVPSLYLNELNEMVKGTNIQIGAQNIYQEKSGAYTGEISIEMLNSININHTLVGHSERRQYFNETDEIVNQKAILCLENNINPVICIGETLEERNAEITNQVLKDQTTKALNDIKENDLKNIIIAYEPIWAIGTGKTATAEDANEACKYVRKVVASLYNEAVANSLVIQYGGSVKPENIKEILSQSDINGALVGGASLEEESYIKLIK